MDIIGKWKVKQLNIPTLDGVIQCTPDNMPEGEIFEEFAPMANAIFEFTPEGSLDMLLSFSAEELEDAAKHGERVRILCCGIQTVEGSRREILLS